MKQRKKREKKVMVCDHLEHTLKKTTYAMRLKWLEEADHFARSIRKAKVVKK